MTRTSLFAALIALAAVPAQAASTNPFSRAFYSLTNTNLIVWIAFILFIAVLFYFKVPSIIGGMLDTRAEGIRAELDEARALREEAQTLLASYERKQREVAGHAEKIVEQAREEASMAAEQAKRDLEASVARRLQGAEDQIASAEAAAVRGVRDQAVAVAVAAAGDVLAKKMDADGASALIDASIKTVEDRLH